MSVVFKQLGAGGVAGALSGVLAAAAFHRSALDKPLLASRALLGTISTVSIVACKRLGNFLERRGMITYETNDNIEGLGLAGSIVAVTISALYMNRRAGLPISWMECSANFVVSAVFSIVAMSSIAP